MEGGGGFLPCLKDLYMQWKSEKQQVLKSSACPGLGQGTQESGTNQVKR